MGTNVAHISCPACKGAIGVTNIDRLVSCAYCHANLLVDHPDYVPRYCVEAAVDDVFARRKLQQFLTQDFLPKGLLRNARFHAAMLCYVPFYEYKARRLGTIEMTVEHATKTQLVTDYNANNGVGTVSRLKKQKVARRETEVVAGDIHRIEPAVELPQFGLEHCGVYSILKEKPALQPFLSSDQVSRARVYFPTKSSQMMTQQPANQQISTSIVDETEYVEARTRVVYYPFWRLRYRFSGRLYNAVVDGVTGELIVARAPEAEQLRVLALVFGVGLFGLILGAIMKSAAMTRYVFALENNNSSGYGFSFLLMGGFLLVSMTLLGGLAWSQFRYPGEVCKWANSYHVEKYNSLLRKRVRMPLLTISTAWKVLFRKATSPEDSI